ncbi:MAG: hypothetical protein QOF62_1314 [Pyrinomonadaceae bacterium]|jgi:hypothetical protein|nr:hypothetical protein [Pyrinomonadaceae bacterium]
MANECSGAWKSKLTKLRNKNGPVTPEPIVDGVITIDTHAGSSFTGHRDKAGDPKPSQALHHTSCQSGAGTTAISFLRTGTGEIYHYHGVLGNNEIKGIYFVTNGPPDPGDSGTWEASQGGGGGGLVGEGGGQADDQNGKKYRSEEPK